MKLFLSFTFSLLILFPVCANGQEQPATRLENSKIQARYELNEGAKAYKQRNFEQAELHFRRALELDSSDLMPRRFLARTLHQQFLASRSANRNLPDIKKGEEAIEIYQNLLESNLNDEDTNRALSNLIELIKGETAKMKWLEKRAANEKVKPEFRSESFTVLGSISYNCANDITEAAKKVVRKNEEIIFIFKKPKNLKDFELAKECAEEGLNLINRALELNDRNESAWSYKASFLVQKARLAEMEGDNDNRDKYRAESARAKERFFNVDRENTNEKEKQEFIKPQ